MNSNPKLHPAVVAELVGRFAPAEVEAARTLLEQTHLPLINNALQAARVHMAAIKWANGDLARLKSATGVAASDWRDLLVLAGLASGEWRAALAQAGFRIPD